MIMASSSYYYYDHVECTTSTINSGTNTVNTHNTNNYNANMRRNIRTFLEYNERSLAWYQSTLSKTSVFTKQWLMRNSSTTKKFRRNTTNRKKPTDIVAINDGLVLSIDQIKRIWKSNECNEIENNSFELREFLIDFPHVNPSLSEEIEQDLHTDDDKSIQDYSKDLSRFKSNKKKRNSDIDMSNFKFPDSNIAVQAEEKLYRMLSRVKSQDSIPSAMRSQIKVLLMEEFETVIDVWLSLAARSIKKSNNDDEDYNSKMEQESLAALFRASKLLLDFEAEFIIELRKSVSYGEDTELYLGAPHTINYQKIISAFYAVFNKKEETMALSNLESIQFQCSNLLKRMMKHIISRRMVALNDDIGHNEQEDQQPLIEQRGNFALSTSFKQLISMYTSRRNITTYAHAVEKVTMASTLLQEMELYFHDFYTIPSPSDQNQQFLLSINPPKRAFNSVIHFYSNIAIKNKCSSCAMKTIEILNRMNKRHLAYGKKYDEQDDSDNIIALSNLSSLKAVFGAFASLDQIEPGALQDLNVLATNIKNDKRIKMDSTLMQLIGECL